MAEYTVASGEVGAYEKTLVAATVDTVTFAVAAPSSTPGWGRPPKTVEVTSDGTASMFGTSDGTEPTVGGAHCWYIPPFPGSSVIRVDDDNPADAVVIKVISAGTPEYSVSRVD